MAIIPTGAPVKVTGFNGAPGLGRSVSSGSAPQRTVPGAKPRRVAQPKIKGSASKPPKAKPIRVAPIGGEPKNQAPFTKPATNGRTPVPSSSVTGTVKPPVVTPPKQPQLTPQQQAQQAVQQALAPLYASQQSDAAARNAAITQFTQALMQAVSGAPSQFANLVNPQIQGQADLATAAANALKNANPNQSDQQMLSFLNAPGAQKAQVANLLNNAFGGGAAVQLYANGQLPVGDLRSQAAGELAQLAQLPALEGLRGQQTFAQALQQEAQAKAAIDAQAPDLQQKYLVSLNTANYQNAELGLKKQAQNSTDAYRRATLALNTAKVNQAGQKNTWQQTYQTGLLKLKQQGLITDAQYKKASLGLKQQSLNSTNAYRQATLALKAAGFKTVGSAKTGYYAVHPDGSKTLLIPPVGNAPTASNPFPNLSKSQIQHLRSGIATAFYGRPAQKDATGKKIVAAALKPLSYQEAITEGVKEGYSRAAATRMANRFYMPGQRGRPKASAPASGASYNVATPKGAMQYAASRLPAYGWGPQEMAALTQLWNNESGWNYKALNPTSGAAGIPQALGHAVPVDYRTNPKSQIEWGLKYIKQRYGTPTNALRFWYSTKPAGLPQGHWY